MPTRPDIRDLASNVREAFADADRDTLLDVLTFVVKEYVVDGPPPMLMHQAETIAELTALSFPQLIATLQTRLELPELALFAVDGEHVSVRVGGVMQPLQPGRSAPAAELPRPQAGVRVVETDVQMRRPATPPAQPAAAPAAAPPPSRGLSIRGVASDGPVTPPAGASSAPAAPAGGAAAAPAAKPDEPKGDDAEARFSLLELD